MGKIGRLCNIVGTRDDRAVHELFLPKFSDYLELFLEAKIIGSDTLIVELSAELSV